VKVSIIIPSFNEGLTLFEVVRKVLSVRLSDYSKEIIIVDDGSWDDTPKILKKLSKDKRIKLIINNKNLGKGASILKAFKIAQGDIIVIQDADLEYDPADIPKLLKPFQDKKVKVVYGSRVLGHNPVSHWTFNLGGRLITSITNLVYGTKITDEPISYQPRPVSQKKIKWHDGLFAIYCLIKYRFFD